MSNSNNDLGDFSMLELFSLEVETQTATLNENLLALETNPGSATELEALMRAAHSIKGAARIVQIDLAVSLAHTMEDCFVAAIDHKITLNADDIDILLQGVDWLSKIGEVGEDNLTTWLTENEGELNQQIQEIATILEPKTKSNYY
jgi:two-component system, chemotaxis family, sensor histidine kinase and response regulator WspE